jgi:outer membrane protein TolC
MGLSDRSDISKIKIMNLEYMKSRDFAATRFDVMSRKIFKWQTGRSITGELKIIPENNPVIKADSKMGLDIESVRRMKLLRLSRELLREQLKKENNEIMPDLNFSLNYKFRNYNQSSEKAFESFNYQNYTMGLNFTQPLGAIYSRGKINELEAKIKKWDADAKSFERNYTQSYHELIKISDIYKKILEYDRLLVEQSRIQHYEEEKKYFQGRADLYFVVQYRNSMLAYELMYLRDTIESKKTEIQLLGLLDKIYRR